MEERSTIRRRHVFYLSGYDPDGPAVYHRRFGRELRRAQKIWPMTVSLSDLAMDADGRSGRWRIESEAPGWRVETGYEFLVWDDLIRGDMSRPLPIMLVLLLKTIVQNILNGTLYRLFRASWRFGLFYLLVVVRFVGLFLLPAAAAAVLLSALPSVWGLSLAATGVVGLFVMLLQRSRAVIQLIAAWIWFGERASGRRPDLSQRLDEFARKVIDKAALADVDEILVIGHSAGGTISISMMARALAIKPDFAVTGSPVRLLVLGSSLPLAALHPKGDDVRNDIAALARNPSLPWIECQAGKDIMNFENFDMVRGCGIDPGQGQFNPLRYPVHHRDGISPENYRRARRDLGRMHFQFIMANDRRAPYDFIMFVCGPAPILRWARNGWGTLAWFDLDASYWPDC